MANLNLSEFTEKLFVADADHTFIWDTAASISKRVSRNSWLNSGTLTSDAPVTISQTWNGTGSTVFKALVVNATTPGTTSSSSSLLLDLQVGGVSQFNVTKAGLTTSATLALTANTNQLLKLNAANWFGTDTSQVYLFNSAFGATVSFNNNKNVIVRFDGGFGWSGSANASSSIDTLLVRDGAGTLALRYGAEGQTFNVYGTYTSGTSYERLTLSAPSAANAIIGTNKGSGGGTARGLDLHTDGAARMTITTAGNVGIGTTSPTSKLQVSAGDVEVDTIAKGVILKSPDGTRYRVTVANGGTLSVAAV